jgi:hypothetical protein
MIELSCPVLPYPSRVEVYEEFCIIDFDHFPEFSVRIVTLLRGPEIIGRRPHQCARWRA